MNRLYDIFYCFYPSNKSDTKHLFDHDDLEFRDMELRNLCHWRLSYARSITAVISYSFNISQSVRPGMTISNCCSISILNHLLITQSWNCAEFHPISLRVMIRWTEDLLEILFSVTESNKPRRSSEISVSLCKAILVSGSVLQSNLPLGGENRFISAILKLSYSAWKV